jgi:hypothetical protein
MGKTVVNLMTKALVWNFVTLMITALAWNVVDLLLKYWCGMLWT